MRESVAGEGVLLFVVPEKFAGDLKCTKRLNNPQFLHSNLQFMFTAW